MLDCLLGDRTYRACFEFLRIWDYKVSCLGFCLGDTLSFVGLEPAGWAYFLFFFRTDCVFVDRLVDTRTYRELCREHCLHVCRIAGDDYGVPVHDLREGVSTPVQNLQRIKKEMSKTKQNKTGKVTSQETLTVF